MPCWGLGSIGFHLKTVSGVVAVDVAVGAAVDEGDPKPWLSGRSGVCGFCECERRRGWGCGMKVQEEKEGVEVERVSKEK